MRKHVFIKRFADGSDDSNEGYAVSTKRIPDHIRNAHLLVPQAEPIIPDSQPVNDIAPVATDDVPVTWLGFW